MIKKYLHINLLLLALLGSVQASDTARIAKEVAQTNGAMKHMQEPHHSPIEQLKEMRRQAKYSEDYSLRVKICQDMIYLLATGEMKAPHTFDGNNPFTYYTYKITAKATLEKFENEVRLAYAAGFLGGKKILELLRTLINRQDIKSPLYNHQRALYMVVWQALNPNKRKFEAPSGFGDVSDEGSKKYFSENTKKWFAEEKKDLEEFSSLLTVGYGNIKTFLNETVPMQYGSVTFNEFIKKYNEGGFTFDKDFPEIWLKCLYRLKIEEEIKAHHLKENRADYKIDEKDRSATNAFNYLIKKQRENDELQAKFSFLNPTEVRHDINHVPTLFHKVGDVTVPVKSFVFPLTKESISKAIKPPVEKGLSDTFDFSSDEKNLTEYLGNVKQSIEKYFSVDSPPAKTSFDAPWQSQDGTSVYLLGEHMPFANFITSGPLDRGYGDTDVKDLRGMRELDSKAVFVPKGTATWPKNMILEGLNNAYESEKEKVTKELTDLKVTYSKDLEDVKNLNTDLTEWDRLYTELNPLATDPLKTTSIPKTLNAINLNGVVIITKNAKGDLVFDKKTDLEPEDKTAKVEASKHCNDFIANSKTEKGKKYVEFWKVIDRSLDSGKPEEICYYIILKKPVLPDDVKKRLGDNQKKIKILNQRINELNRLGTASKKRESENIIHQPSLNLTDLFRRFDAYNTYGYNTLSSYIKLSLNIPLHQAETREHLVGSPIKGISP